MLTKTASDTALRLQPKSAIMGLTSTPIISRAPAFRNRMTNEAATTYQPKEMVGLVLLMDPGTDHSCRRCALTSGAYACRPFGPSSASTARRQPGGRSPQRREAVGVG